jgi:UDP-N-acetyl-D-glucosamine dehydrogenase
MLPEALAARIAKHDVRVTVVGQGYVGLPLAVALARVGFEVVGLDSDLDRVASLAQGISHTPDVVNADLQAALASGRYQPSTDLDALRRSDVTIICVPTPLRKSKDPDISFVVAAGENAAARFRPPQLVILESTTYPGTCEELLLPMFEARGAVLGRDFFLAFSPERIDPGNHRFPVRAIPKVVGGLTPACTRLAATFYAELVDRVLQVSSPKVAELAKLYENVFRNVNIALANELSLICRRLGVPTREVIDAASTKPFGFMPFYPGPGIGGHCIGIDPFYLAWKTRLNGYEARFIHLADEINEAMPQYVVELVADALNERRRAVNGARILGLGVAYKRGVGDTRESPAIEVLARLHARGAVVSYADPWVPEITLAEGVTLKSTTADDGQVSAADCVVVLTDHAEFDYARIVELAAVVVDTRNATWGTPGAERVIRL